MYVFQNDDECFLAHKFSAKWDIYDVCISFFYEIVSNAERRFQNIASNVLNFIFYTGAHNIHYEFYCLEFLAEIYFVIRIAEV